MADTLQVPDWCTPGADVAVLFNTLGRDRVTRTKIKSVAAKSVSTTDGDRYKPGWKDELQHRVGGTWGTVYTLLPLTDPRVRRALRGQRVRGQRVRGLLSTVDAAVQSLRKTGVGELTAADVRAAAAHLLVLADLIEQTGDDDV